MVVSVLAMALAGLLNGTVGYALLRLLCGAKGLRQHPVFAVALGLAVTSVLAAALSLASPLDWRFWVAESGAFLLAWGYLRQTNGGASAMAYLIFGDRTYWLALIFCCAFAAQTSLVYDDGLYYQQNIRWIERYAVVPGLGNLHGRLAFNSHWHLLAAGFGGGWLTDAPVYDLNALLSAWLIAFAWQDGFKCSSMAEGWRTFSPLVLFWERAHLTAPAADLAVYLYAALIVWLYLKKTEERDYAAFDTKALLMYVLPMFLVTVKLSSIFLALFPLGLLLRQYWFLHKRDWVALISAGLTFATPWMARNVMLSGYLAYPVAGTDIVHTDWRMPEAVVAHEVDMVESWAKGRLSAGLAEASLTEWMPVWWSIHKPHYQALGVLIGLAWLLAVFFAVNSANGKRWLWLALLAGTAFWFLKAPDFRFGYAFTMPLIWLTAFRLAGKRLERFVRFGALVGAALTVAWLVYELHKANAPFHVLLPAEPLPAAQEGRIESIRFSNGDTVEYRYLMPEEDRCWDAPLPCGLFPLKGRVEARGDDLQDGFRPARAARKP